MPFAVDHFREVLTLNSELDELGWNDRFAAAFDDLDDARVHGRDERIGVAAFGEELEFTYRLMRELASTP